MKNKQKLYGKSNTIIGREVMGNGHLSPSFVSFSFFNHDSFIVALSDTKDA